MGLNFPPILLPLGVLSEALGSLHPPHPRLPGALILRQFGPKYFCLGFFLVLGFHFVFSFIVVPEASSVWHLTNF